jgi:hypothetical protein
VSETIKIPAQYHSALIGQGGKYAIRLEDNYNVKVTFPRHGESGEGRTREPLKADEVLIKGGRKGVAHAKKELLDVRGVGVLLVLLTDHRSGIGSGEGKQL